MKNPNGTKPEAYIYRSRTENEPNLSKYSEQKQKGTLVIKETKPKANPKFSVLFPSLVFIY